MLTLPFHLSELVPIVLPGVMLAGLSVCIALIPIGTLAYLMTRKRLR